MAVEFTDNSARVCAAIDEAIAAALEECGGEFEAQVKRNARVDTGQTKNSFQHKVAGDTVYVGSDHENAIWEEFGTGVYAEGGNGRKDRWAYKDDSGNWHSTKGKRGTRALTKAMRAKAPAAKRICEKKLGASFE